MSPRWRVPPAADADGAGRRRRRRGGDCGGTSSVVLAGSTDERRAERAPAEERGVDRGGGQPAADAARADGGGAGGGASGVGVPELRQRRVGRRPAASTSSASRLAARCRTRRSAPITARWVSSSSSGRGGVRCTELMNPATSAQKFYAALVEVPGWEPMPVTRAAQAVQRSAYPDAYADDEALALRACSGLDRSERHGREPAGSPVTWSDDSCASPTWSRGVVAIPLAAPARATPTSTTSAPPAGTGRADTPAPTCRSRAVRRSAPRPPARSIIETDQSWAGPWLVQVSTGEGRLTTWYAHMQSVDVADGQQVQAGQQLGEVGSLGNSTGCHLHFEVHPQGGAIYEDDVDPSEWLQTTSVTPAVETPSPCRGTRPASSSPASTSWATRTPSLAATDQGWASSRTRMRGAVQLFDRYGVDVVGLQEFQPTRSGPSSEPRAAATRSTRRRAATPTTRSPGAAPAGNSSAPRRSRSPTSTATSGQCPSSGCATSRRGGQHLRQRAQPGRAPSGHPNQGAHRAEAVRREIAAVRALTTTYELPVFLTGDLNDRAEAFCAFTAGGSMTAAAGGTHAGRCNVRPRPLASTGSSPPRLRRSARSWSFATVSTAGSATTRSSSPAQPEHRR